MARKMTYTQIERENERLRRDLSAMVRALAETQRRNDELRDRVVALEIAVGIKSRTQ